MTDEPLRATVSQRGVLFGPEGDVLVVRRASDDGWELPGGRLGAGEETVRGLRREVEEETGLDPSVAEPVHTYAWRSDGTGRGRFAVYYVCRVERRAVSLSPEHTEFDWLPPATAAERLSETQGVAVDRARTVVETDGRIRR
ncbi:NUDIX domain-containing protein [Halobium salinum]|uniref:NUDIX domain-containing protein n=1 Tax=Halobium salinum TaxID=1364940 RepID=A0ABD5PBP3_9EURY|nr:NUDIX hydrolase [Halobium salinum]